VAGSVAPVFWWFPAPAFLAVELDNADVLVPGIGLRAGGAALLSGQAGVGKSLLTLGLFVEWAEGGTPFGCEALRPTRPLRIVAMYLEDDSSIVQERLRAVLRGRRAPEGLILFLRDEAVRLAGPKGEPDTASLGRLRATLEAHRPVDVCMVDPLIYVHDADENVATEMARWLRPVRECVRGAGAATWLVHHAGWDQERGRGSTAIQAWADLELSITRKAVRGRELTRLSLVKTNFAPRWPAPVALTFDARTLGFRVADEAATLCPPEELAAWVRTDLAGGWQGKLTGFYATVAQHFQCSRRTAEAALKLAVQAGLLAREGRGEAARVWAP
jgi:hypothetical protein